VSRWREQEPAAVDVGHPGESARAEFERLVRRENARREAIFGRPLASVVKVVVGTRASTAAWARGGRGEAQVGNYLSRAVGRHGVVLHDRRVRGTRANIDHIAVVASGVWVIDTKCYRGCVESRAAGGWLVTHPALFVNGRNRSNLVAGAQHQCQLVRLAVGPEVDVRVALCFTGAGWRLGARPFTLEGVLVTWPRKLAGTLSARGGLEAQEMETLARRIARAFPPYAPSGTSHNPTGALPNG
jgi:hypothetical protein